MIFIVLSVAVSLGAMLFFLKIAKSREGLWKILGLSFGGAVCSLILFGPALLLQMLGTFIAAIVCLAFKPNRLLTTALMIAPFVIAYAVAFYYPLSELTELARLRQEFPFESVATRLEYEQKREVLPKGLATLQLSKEVDKQLEKFDNRDSSNTRRWMLEMLHNRTHDQFVLAQGFGPVRMARVRPEVIVLPESKPISVEVPLSRLSALRQEVSASDVPAADSLATNSLPAKESLMAMHRQGLDNFFDEERMGYIQDRNHVAGFQSHAFTKMPGATDEPWRKSWKIARLELIGLLKYDKPKAYISEHLPQTDELADAPTRDLHNFEKMALGRLRTNEDLVIDETPDRIQMVGSLRAGNNCLQCHDVQRGELLGALTYGLVPTEDKPTFNR